MTVYTRLASNCRSEKYLYLLVVHTLNFFPHIMKTITKDSTAVPMTVIMMITFLMPIAVTHGVKANTSTIPMMFLVKVTPTKASPTIYHILCQSKRMKRQKD